MSAPPSSSRILFYTDIPRAFRSTLIGYLYELTRTYPVTLLSEELDDETSKFLSNKKLFPGLSRVIPVSQFGKRSSFLSYRKLARLAKRIIQEEQPSLVFATGVYPFETFLRRYAKRAGATTISAIGPIYGQTLQRRRFHLLLNAQRLPFFVPLSLRLLLVRAKKYFAHIIFYWILPLSLFELPFFRHPSFSLTSSYARYKYGADYYLAFLEQDYRALIKIGVPKDKLLLVAHPLCGVSRDFFDDSYFARAKVQANSSTPVALVLWPDAYVGFKRETYHPIAYRDILHTNLDIVKTLARNLPDWDIFIKPHPTMNHTHSLKRLLGDVARVTVLDPSAPLDSYIQRASLVVGVPPVSTSLFTARLQYPHLPLLSLDFTHELLGDSFARFDGITYIDAKKDFVDTLYAIRKGMYRKHFTNKKLAKGFAGLCQALQAGILS